MAKKLVERKTVEFAPGENTHGLQVIREAWDVNGKPKTYWKYGLPDVAQVIAFTPERKIIAISEFQPGVGADYTHLIGETIEAGEEPLEAARRGLLEETGYESDNFALLSTILENSGRSDRKIHIFLAMNCRKAAIGEEDVKIELLEPSDFWNRMMVYFTTNVFAPHGGGNSLKAMALAFHLLGLTTVSKET